MASYRITKNSAGSHRIERRAYDIRNDPWWEPVGTTYRTLEEAEQAVTERQKLDGLNTWTKVKEY